MSPSLGDLSEENFRLAKMLLDQEAEVQRHRRRLKLLGLDPGPHHGSVPRPGACLRRASCKHVFHCPVCGAGSSHPDDAENGYCGRCGYVGADGVTDEARLRVELQRRTTEWQAEQQTRITAEQERVAADQRTEHLRDALRGYAARLETLAGGGSSDPAQLAGIAREMRATADTTRQAHQPKETPPDA